MGRYEEEMEAEVGGGFDDVRERFSGEFSPCPACGERTTDAFGHCPPPDPDEEGRHCPACGADILGNDPHAPGCPSDPDPGG